MGRMHWTMQALAGLVGITSLAAVGAVPYWILRPIDRAAKDRRHPYQFTLADFACLFFLVQLSMAPGHLLFRGEVRAMAYLLDLYGWVASGLMWWFGVQRLSRAGVRKPWHRVIFLAIVMPATLCGALGVPAMVLLTIAAFTEPRFAFSAGGIVAATAGALAGLYGCAWFTRRIVAAASPATPEAPTAEAAPPHAGEDSGQPSQSAHQGKHH